MVFLNNSRQGKYFSQFNIDSSYIGFENQSFKRYITRINIDFYRIKKRTKVKCCQTIFLILKRILAVNGPILALQGNTEFICQRGNPDRIGLIQRTRHLGKNAGLKSEHKVCGILMHASLIVTSEWLPLGLTSTCYWFRKVFKNTNQMKCTISQTLLSIEKKALS